MLFNNFAGVVSRARLSNREWRSRCKSSRNGLYARISRKWRARRRGEAWRDPFALVTDRLVAKQILCYASIWPILSLHYNPGFSRNLHGPRQRDCNTIHFWRVSFAGFSPESKQIEKKRVGNEMILWFYVISRDIISLLFRFLFQDFKTRYSSPLRVSTELSIFSYIFTLRGASKERGEYSSLWRRFSDRRVSDGPVNTRQFSERSASHNIYDVCAKYYQIFGSDSHRTWLGTVPSSLLWRDSTSVRIHRGNLTYNSPRARHPLFRFLS